MHHQNPKVRRRDYEGQIDDFAVYCPDRSVYLIPIEDVPTRSIGLLRVTPARTVSAKAYAWLPLTRL